MRTALASGSRASSKRLERLVGAPGGERDIAAMQQLERLVPVLALQLVEVRRAPRRPRPRRTAPRRRAARWSGRRARRRRTRRASRRASAIFLGADLLDREDQAGRRGCRAACSMQLARRSRAPRRCRPRRRSAPARARAGTTFSGSDFERRAVEARGVRDVLLDIGRARGEIGAGEAVQLDLLVRIWHGQAPARREQPAAAARRRSELCRNCAARIAVIVS